MQPDQPWLYGFVRIVDDLDDDKFVAPYDAREIIGWMVEQFGEPGIRWKIWFGLIMLADQTDATAFRIAWG